MESIVDREWKKYQGYVRRTANTVAAQFAGRVDPDDLGQAGLVALLEVCERFDPTRAETFGAYVRLRVRGAIFDAAREETKRPPQPSRSAPPSPTSRQKRRRPSPADRLRRVPDPGRASSPSPGHNSVSLAGQTRSLFPLFPAAGCSVAMDQATGSGEPASPPIPGGLDSQWCGQTDLQGHPQVRGARVSRHQAEREGHPVQRARCGRSSQGRPSTQNCTRSSGGERCQPGEHPYRR